MSATLDSNLFARYYGDCPVLVAGGRTFPVEHHFLEDTYELTGCCSLSSPCSFHGMPSFSVACGCQAVINDWYVIRLLPRASMFMGILH